MIGYTWAQAGDSTKARALLEEWRSWPAQRYVPPLNVAMVHLGLKERDECFAWLEKAMRIKMWDYVFCASTEGGMRFVPIRVFNRF